MGSTVASPIAGVLGCEGVWYLRPVLVAPDVYRGWVTRMFISVKPRSRAGMSAA
jgi:hypothetical protein